MGYVLQSHVRALVVTDAVGRVMVRSIIRLVLRSDSLTPVVLCDHTRAVHYPHRAPYLGALLIWCTVCGAQVVFCDPMFFTLGYSAELQRELLAQVQSRIALVVPPGTQ